MGALHPSISRVGEEASKYNVGRKGKGGKTCSYKEVGGHLLFLENKLTSQPTQPHPKSNLSKHLCTTCKEDYGPASLVWGDRFAKRS